MLINENLTGITEFLINPNSWCYKMLWLIFAYKQVPAVRKLQDLTLTWAEAEGARTAHYF